MSVNEKLNRRNPRDSTTFIGALFWTWMVKFFYTGYKKTLEKDDLYDPLKADRSEKLGDQLERCWNIELDNLRSRGRAPSLFRALFRCFFSEFFPLAIVHILNDVVLRLGRPLLIGQLLRYFREDEEVSYTEALLNGFGICLGTGVFAVTVHYWYYRVLHMGGRIRIAICSLMYRKALRLNMRALGDTTPGKLLNLLATDVARFEFVMFFVNYLWSAPLATLSAGYFLWTEAGYAGLIGLAVILISVPIQSYLGKLSAKFRLQTTVHTDERVRLMNEIVSGIQVIKMYAWETPFCKLIALVRKLELKQIRRNTWILGLFMAMYIFLPRVALYSTLVSMIFFGQHLSLGIVFIFFSYFVILSDMVGFMFARAVSEISQCYVTIQRLQNFLMVEEFRSSQNNSVSINNCKSKRISNMGIVKIDNVFKTAQTLTDTITPVHKWMDNKAYVEDEKNLLNEEHKNLSVKFVNLTAKWLESSTQYTLADINAEIERGKLYMIIGAVGSGKSSLIASIFGEISILEGFININGSISYASQEAWIFGATVRQNILFGQQYDSHRYQEVVKACALLSDFVQFPEGDATIVGERGSSLSGGQKARINLARCVYRQADIYIFDDPLSAVDTQVSKHLFEECFQKYLAGKTRILMTHQLQYLHRADNISVLHQGQLEEFKSYDDLLSVRAEYLNLLSANANTTHNADLSKNNVFPNGQSVEESNKNNGKNSSDKHNSRENDASDGKMANILEETSKGTVKGSIFLQYLTVGNNWFIVFLVGFLLVATQCALSAYDIFFPQMVSAEEKRYAEYQANLANASNSSEILEEYSIEPTYEWIYTYTGITLSIFVLSAIQSLIFCVMCMRSSQHLHDKAFGALIRTGMLFFNKNPSGRILNRFSKDLDSIDCQLPKFLNDASVFIMMGFGVLAVVCSINPFFLAPLAVIIIFFYWLLRIYIKTSKNVKRLEGMLRSPVFTHLNVTMSGLMTIRAFNAQDMMKVEFDQFQNGHTAAWYMSIAASNAFGFSLDFFYCLLTTIVTFGLLLTSGYTGSQVGLSITIVVSMTTLLQWGMRQAAEVVNQTMCVERVLEYTLLPAEHNLSRQLTEHKSKVKKGNAKGSQALVSVPENWPTEGCIVFKHVSMKYSEDGVPVLKDLNFTIKPREQVGIVGRTGAGKSSLISTLFRLAKVEGIIEIDDLDTGAISLEELRKNIAIIPQDPVLFSGTLRKNLDPFSQFSDDALWMALEQVELKGVVTREVDGLDSKVVDRGMNFSVGQRQLVCLARAILRNNKILVLDEATASVDPHTDMLIQSTIRTQFAGCTVLTVAHRLNTIMDSDKVLVMDDGCIVEYDHPYILLQDQYGKFTSLVNQTGESMSHNLSKIAKTAYEEKYHEHI